VYRPAANVTIVTYFTGFKEGYGYYNETTFLDKVKYMTGNTNNNTYILPRRIPEESPLRKLPRRMDYLLAQIYYVPQTSIMIKYLLVLFLFFELIRFCINCV
jgi:hypothetical protein